MIGRLLATSHNELRLPFLCSHCRILLSANLEALLRHQERQYSGPRHKLVQAEPDLEAAGHDHAKKINKPTVPSLGHKLVEADEQEKNRIRKKILSSSRSTAGFVYQRPTFESPTHRDITPDPPKHKHPLKKTSYSTPVRVKPSSPVAKPAALPSPKKRKETELQKPQKKDKYKY